MRRSRVPLLCQKWERYVVGWTKGGVDCTRSRGVELFIFIFTLCNRRDNELCVQQMNAERQNLNLAEQATYLPSCGLHNWPWRQPTTLPCGGTGDVMHAQQARVSSGHGIPSFSSLTGWQRMAVEALCCPIPPRRASSNRIRLDEFAAVKLSCPWWHNSRVIEWDMPGQRK